MSDMTPKTLHPEYFGGPFAAEMRFGLKDRMTDFYQKWYTGDQQPLTGISAALYSYDDSPEAVGRAFEDLRNQIFVKDVEMLFVDAGTADGRSNEPARMVAREHGARIGSVAIGHDFRADILNKCVDMAGNDNVWMMPAHATVASNVALAAARWQMKPNGSNEDELVVGGVYGVVIPDQNASNVERTGAYLMGATKRLSRPAAPQEPGGAGYLDASCSMVSKRAVKGMRPPGSSGEYVAPGYPTEYGAGGADGELGRRMNACWYTEAIENGERSSALQVIEDGALAVHHTHGFGVLDAARQLWRWKQMSRPRDFIRENWLWHPNLGL